MPRFSSIFQTQQLHVLKEEEKEEIESIFQFPSEEEDEITFLSLFQKIIILSVGYAFSGPWHVAIWD